MYTFQKDLSAVYGERGSVLYAVRSCYVGVFVGWLMLTWCLLLRCLSVDCIYIFMTDPMKVIESHGADALRMYLINSPVVRAESLKFKEEGVQSTVREVLLPWFNAFRFFVQQVKLSLLSYFINRNVGTLCCFFC